MSRIFEAIVKTRSRLYDRGTLPTRRLDHPVISVGNLTTGGTGKTPLVIELAARFRDLGYTPVVLMRGYRRRSRGIVVVSRGKGPEVGWEEAGDEPMLITVRVPGVSVVVGRDRYEAGLRAEREQLGDLFLLDDGFQHRRLHREVDLVTIDAPEWHAGQRLLPRGNWREPLEAINRAHAACVARSEGTPPVRLPIPRFGVETRVDGVVRDGTLVSPDTLKGQILTAFAGIAKPERFFQTLEGLGLDLGVRHAFPDHHAYRPGDLANLPAGIRITTEKDAVRLPGDDFCFLRVSAKIREFDSLRDLILERIAPSVRPADTNGPG